MIKDFIKAIKDAYSNIYADKILAKEKINLVKRELEKLKDVYNRIDRIEKDFDVVYHYCPVDERCDFIQKTLDLFRYGKIVKCEDNTGHHSYFDRPGLKDRYKRQIENLQYSLVECKKRYKQHNYIDTIELANSTIKSFDNFFEVYINKKANS